MDCPGTRVPRIRSETHLFSLSGLVAGACLAFVWYTPKPHSYSIPEVIVPLSIAVGLGLYSLRLKRRRDTTSQSKPVAKHAWAGALVSGSIGVVWLALHLLLGLPIDVLPDKLLTVLSVGIAVGALVGQRSTATKHATISTDRSQIVGQRSWTTLSEPTPITDAILDILSEDTDIDALDLDPMYHQMNPEVLSALRSEAGSPWQLMFSIDEYEVHVNSHGAVSVYRIEGTTGVAPTIRPQ